MSQTIGGETTPFTYKSIEGIQSCTVFDVALWGDASYLCVGMPDKVVLLKYNPSLGMYCIRKVLITRAHSLSHNNKDKSIHLCRLTAFS